MSQPSCTVRNAGRPGGAAPGQMGELVLDREFGVHHPALSRSGPEVGQAVIALGADHHVDRGLAGLDLGALGLGDASGDDDPGVEAAGLPLALEHPQAAELGIDLLGGLLADVAGVEDDDVASSTESVGVNPSAPSTSAMRAAS